MQQFGDWALVLPYISTPHWQTNEIYQPWRNFFDLNSLNKFVPVIEILDLIQSGILKQTQLILVLMLQYDYIPL